MAKAVLAFDLAPQDSGVSVDEASNFIQQEMLKMVSQSTDYFPDNRKEKQLRDILYDKGLFHPMSQIDFGRLKALTNLKPEVFQPMQLNVALKYFQLFDSVSPPVEIVQHWENRIRKSKIDFTQHRHLAETANAPDLLRLPEQSYIGGERILSIKDQNKWFTGMCMQHGVLFGDRVKFDEDSVQQQDDADDDDPLVIVVNVDDPDCDVTVRPKSKALEVNELIDLTEDDADIGLVYFASAPSHHSFDENIVKTDSECEMDTTIPVPSQFSTSGESDNRMDSDTAVTDRPAAVLGCAVAPTVVEASGSGTASIAASAAVDPSIIDVWANSHSHLWDKSNPVFIAPALMQTAYSSLLPIMYSYRRKYY
jgi:hypothetical protein